MGSVRWSVIAFAMLAASAARGGDGPKQATFDARHELEVAIPEGAEVVRIWFTEPQADAASEPAHARARSSRRPHTLTRSIDGRQDDTLVTEDDAVARQWLTTLTRLPIVRASRLDPGRDYYVRISAQARPRGGSLIGLASAVTGQAKFTLIR